MNRYHCKVKDLIYSFIGIYLAHLWILWILFYDTEISSMKSRSTNDQKSYYPVLEKLKMAIERSTNATFNTKHSSNGHCLSLTLWPEVSFLSIRKKFLQSRCAIVEKVQLTFNCHEAIRTPRFVSLCLHRLACLKMRKRARPTNVQKLKMQARTP